MSARTPKKISPIAIDGKAIDTDNEFGTSDKIRDKKSTSINQR